MGFFVWVLSLLPLQSQSWAAVTSGWKFPKLPPSIVDFSASPVLVKNGSTALLTAHYLGRSATVDHGVGKLKSGVPKATGRLNATTTFKLTVDWVFGRKITATRTVEVTPLTMSSIVGPSSLEAGATATYLITLSGGETNAVTWSASAGRISSGGVFTAPSTGQKVTLTAVSQDDPSRVMRLEVTISGSPVEPGTMTFTTEGRSFAPVLVLFPQAQAQVTWTWSDGSASHSLRPNKSFGSAATRVQRLVVQPWSAIQRINIGYDSNDGGSDDIEHVPDQHVSAVGGMNVVAATLRQWCSSYNRLSSLDFSNFVNLDTIECYQSKNLVSVNLHNTPQLRRLCLEQCNLAALDVSQSPLLEDLRGAINQYATVEYGSTGAHLWHICTRDNEQITHRSLYSDLSKFPNISELFIWNDNQAGTLRVPASSPDKYVFLIAYGNDYTHLDLRGALRNPENTGIVDLSNNQLVSVNINGCVQISSLDLNDNLLSSATVDYILVALDSLGRSRANTPSWTSLDVDLTGNAVPGPAGMAAARSLAAKGWRVAAEGWTQ